LSPLPRAPPSRWQAGAPRKTRGKILIPLEGTHPLCIANKIRANGRPSRPTLPDQANNRIDMGFRHGIDCCGFEDGFMRGVVDGSDCGGDLTCNRLLEGLLCVRERSTCRDTFRASAWHPDRLTALLPRGTLRTTGCPAHIA